MRTVMRIACAVIVTSLLAVTSVEARTRIYVQIGPPPIVAERVVVAPGPGYAWQDGYYRWTGAQYVWARGLWARRPYGHARWIPGRWVYTPYGYYWRGRPLAP